MRVKGSVHRLCAYVLGGIALLAIGSAAVVTVAVWWSRPTSMWEKFLQDTETLRQDLAGWEETHTPIYASRAVELLSARGRSMVPVLESLVGDENPKVSTIAVICLGNLGCRRSRYVLRSALTYENNEVYRPDALFALAQLGDAYALAPLHALSDGDPSPMYRTVEALAMLGDYSRVPVLIDGIGKEDEDSYWTAPNREYAAENVLERISGEHFCTDAEKWKEWHEAKMKTNPPPAVAPKEIAKWKEIFAGNSDHHPEAPGEQKQRR